MHRPAQYIKICRHQAEQKSPRGIGEEHGTRHPFAGLPLLVCDDHRLPSATPGTGRAALEQDTAPASPARGHASTATPSAQPLQSLCCSSRRQSHDRRRTEGSKRPREPCWRYPCGRSRARRRRPQSARRAQRRAALLLQPTTNTRPSEQRSSAKPTTSGRPPTWSSRVKEPVKEEFYHFRPGLTLFTLPAPRAPQGAHRRSARQEGNRHRLRDRKRPRRYTAAAYADVRGRRTSLRPDRRRRIYKRNTAAAAFCSAAYPARCQATSASSAVASSAPTPQRWRSASVRRSPSSTSASTACARSTTYLAVGSSRSHRTPTTSSAPPARQTCSSAVC